MSLLSVVIITHNEEHNIRRCLESVRSVADEIVVVDSNSTDATAEICREFGARVIDQPWLGYAAQKNFANQQAQHDWILSMDADEELDYELQHAILSQKSLGFSGAYILNRLTIYCGHPIRHSGWYPDPKIRLWNRKQGAWQGYIHETVEFTENVAVLSLPGHLNHYSYHSITEHIKQADKFTTMTAEEAFKNGTKRKSRCAIRCKTAWKFFRDYVLRLGFLDGYYGFVVCRISAFATFLKYIKINELHNQATHGTSENRPQ